MAVLLLMVSFYMDGPGAYTSAGPAEDGGTVWVSHENSLNTFPSGLAEVTFSFRMELQQLQSPDLEHGAEKMLRLPLVLPALDSCNFEVT